VIVRSASASRWTNARRCGPARHGAVAQAVVAEGGQEEALAGEAGKLDRGHGAAPSRRLPRLERMDDLTRRRHAFDARELDPLDVPDDSDSHKRE
jgi:hypothetical protein